MRKSEASYVKVIRRRYIRLVNNSTHSSLQAYT